MFPFCLYFFILSFGFHTAIALGPERTRDELVPFIGGKCVV